MQAPSATTKRKYKTQALMGAFCACVLCLRFVLAFCTCVLYLRFVLAFSDSVLYLRLVVAFFADLVNMPPNQMT